RRADAGLSVVCPRSDRDMVVQRLLSVVLFLMISTVPAAYDVPITLRGSPESMLRQSAVAEEAGYALAATSREVRALVEEGVFVPLEGNADYQINRGVSAPVARPELRLFVERLA